MEFTDFLKNMLGISKSFEIVEISKQEQSKKLNIKPLNTVIATFERYKQGIINAFKTKTNSGKHENLNGKIQAVLAKARGFLNFDRFRVNVLFYFGKLDLVPQ